VEEWWAYQLSVAPPETILRMSEEVRARFKEEYFARLRPLLRPDGLHLPVTAIYAVAQR
jgi:hypothetical protein